MMELAMECTGDILYVAQKSKNLSGPFVRKLNVAASLLTEICERLAGLKDKEVEIRRRANLLRLERLLDIAEKEREAFKRQAEDMCREMAALKASPCPHHPPALGGG